MPTFVPRLSEYSPTDMHEPNPWWWSTGNVYYENNPLPNCTCYCYGRVGEILGNFLATVPHDYAGEWWNLATDMPKGQTPKLGAIACYGEGTYYGHVSIVEQINSDGSIVTSNSGYPTTFFWTETLYPENNYIASWMQRYSYVFQGFLYIDEQEQSVSPYVLSAICGNWKANPQQQNPISQTFPLMQNMQMQLHGQWQTVSPAVQAKQHSALMIHVPAARSYLSCIDM